MGHLRIRTASEQVAAHLRGKLARGGWRDWMPGSDRLVAELGVGRNTVEAALGQLEREGWLENQGRRRRRRIRVPEDAPASGRIGILPYDAADLRLDYLLDLRHRLDEAGHAVTIPPRSLTELRMDPERVARVVGTRAVDAWVVLGGSREVLGWFSASGVPTLAMFGRRRELAIAGVGPDKESATVAATRSLLGLGHRRIVLLARGLRRLPRPGAPERAFLATLAEAGIEPGPYHLPDWEETAEGFEARLDLLTRLSPPTALIVDEVPFLMATLDFCASRGIRVPGDLSLVCTDSSPDFDWCRPTIAHIRWDSGPVVRRVLRWVENVSRGRRDLRQVLTPAEFVPGGTLGPPRSPGNQARKRTGQVAH